MAFADIKPGKYKARAIGGKFGESGKKKTPGVGIKFEFEMENAEGKIVTEHISWTGWLSENAMERTFKALAICGYDESKGNLADGTIPREYFDPKAECEIDIQCEEENYIDRDGNPKSAMKTKVAWVNRLGGGGFQVAEASNVSTMLKSIGGLKAHMQAARADLGLAKPKPTTTAIPAATPKAAPKAAAKPKAEPAPEPEQAADGEPSFDQEEDIPF